MPDKSLNILVAPTLYYVNDYTGSEYAVAHKLLTGLAKRGHRLTIITGIWQVRDFPSSARIVSMVRDGRVQGSFREAWRRLRFPRFVARVGRRQLAEQHYDVIFHLGHGSINTPNRLFWTDRTYPHLMGPMPSTQRYASPHDMSMWLGTRPGIAERLVTIGYRLVRPWLHRNFLRTMRHVDYLICPSELARQEYVRYVSPERIKLIPFGVDPYPAGSRKPGRVPEILAVARIVERKGLDVLLRATAVLKSQQAICSVRIVGEGPARSGLESLADTLGVADQVTFAGKVAHADIPNVYAQADLFCLPSRSEPFSVALLEAMSAGLPVVATAVSELSEIVTKEVGLLVPPDDPRALAKALQQLITDPQRSLAMGWAARRRVLDHYTWDQVVDQYEAALYEALGQHQRSISSRIH